jgi:hypothetical protein
VFLNDVRLEAGPAGSLFYAIGAANHRVLVQFGDGKFRPPTQSTRVDIRGVIHQMPNANAVGSKWRINRRTARKLAEQPVYIVAQEIRQDPAMAR